MDPLIFLVKNLNFLLVEHKFEIYKGQSYGTSSGIVLLRDEYLKLKIVSERKNIFVEIGSAYGDDWCVLSIIKLYTHKTPIERLSREDISSYLESSINDLRSMYQTIDFIDRLEEFKYKIVNKLPLYEN